MTIAARFAPHSDLAKSLLPHLPNTDDGSHDIGHILRVWTNVQTLMQSEGGNTRILAAATLLHDVVAVEKDAPNRAQASRLAADHASTLLDGLGWTIGDIAQTAHAIAAHSFSANIPPETIEAKILQDADRLDAIGLIGVARCFYVSGRMGRAIHHPVDPRAENRPLDDTAFAIDHFETKLLKLADGFQTPTGAKLARARHTKTADFLSGLLSEIGA